MWLFRVEEVVKNAASGRRGSAHTERFVTRHPVLVLGLAAGEVGPRAALHAAARVKGHGSLSSYSGLPRNMAEMWASE